MAVLLTGAITNTILDPILIFGFLSIPALGMRGAAIATVIGQCAAGTVGIILNLKRNKEVPFRKSSFKPDLRMMRDILVIAIPATLTYSINSILIFGITLIISGMTIMMSGVFQAMGHSGRSLAVSIVQAAFLVGSAALLAIAGSTTLVWIAFPISEIVIFALSLVFLRGLYKRYLDSVPER